MTLTHPDRLEVHHDDAEPTSAELVAAHPPAGVQPAAGRLRFTITDAAAACAVSRKTITRKLPELAGHGAAKDEDGVWRIPVEALLAVGLRPGRSLPDPGHTPARPPALRPIATPAQAPPTGTQDTITIARDRWDDLRIRLARAEAEASERSLALADARLALRALTAGPASTAPPFMAPPNVDSVPSPTVSSIAPAPSAGPLTPQPAPEAPAPAAALPEASAPAAQTPNHQSVAAPASPPVGGAADVAAARARAAQSGGHVPAGATTVKKRRWWQSTA